MNLSDGIQLSGAPAIIPDSLRADLPQFLISRGLTKGAEIGVYKGAFTEKFCQAGLQMYAVDPWQAYDGAGRTPKLQARQDFLYEHTRRTLAPYDCTIVRATSMEAVQQFEDESLDFVYIDGNHIFRYVAEDLFEWSRKVRPGGIVSGHDYFDTDPKATNLLCHVRVVVDAYTRLYKISPWWLFGKQRLRSGSSHEDGVPKDDRYYSWMWFKP